MFRLGAVCGSQADVASFSNRVWRSEALTGDGFMEYPKYVLVAMSKITSMTFCLKAVLQVLIHIKIFHIILSDSL